MILQKIKTRSQFLLMLHLQISISFTLRHYIFQQLVSGKVVLPLPAQPGECQQWDQLHVQLPLSCSAPRWGSWCRAEQLMLQDGLPLLPLLSPGAL